MDASEASTSRGKKPYKYSKQNLDTKSNANMSIKRLPRDTTSSLIKELVFDCYHGNYETDLVDVLRIFYNEYHPSTSEMELIRVVLTADTDKLANYIDCNDFYHVGIGIKNLLFEYGKSESDDSIESTVITPKTRNRMMEKLSKYNSRPKKEKKEKKPVVTFHKESKLRDSHLMGLKEGYGKCGLTPPSEIKFGRYALAGAVKEICADYHVLAEGITNKVCNEWARFLSCIVGSLCEGARFDPMCWFISERYVEGHDGRLPSWITYLLNKWEKMSKVHRKIIASKAYGSKVPQGYNDLTEEMVKELCKDIEWVKLVLKIVLGARNSQAIQLGQD